MIGRGAACDSSAHGSATAGDGSAAAGWNDIPRGLGLGLGSAFRRVLKGQESRHCRGLTWPATYTPLLLYT